MTNNIQIKGARVNNLKNIDVEIPRNKFVVITGLSGSGKSSLAFDTLYAEGRRRYVESLSAYARQFLGRLSKPECDFIRGIPPAIAIEQKVNTRNPRSTVGTSTEIYDYMRMLFGRVGHTVSPVSGREVRKQTVEDVLRCAMGYPAGTRIAVAAPIRLPEGRSMEEQIEIYGKEGYSRLIDSEGRFISFENYSGEKSPMLLIDRLAVAAEGSDEASRLAESTETAFFEGHDEASLFVLNGGSSPERHDFSKRFEMDGMVFPELSEQMFNFNSPLGACPVCEGFGRTMGISEALVIPNPYKSLYEECVAPWRGDSMSKWRKEFIEAAGDSFPVHTPYRELTDLQRRLLWEGDASKGIRGINDFFAMLEASKGSMLARMQLARFRDKTICYSCGGTRLRKEASYVHVGGETIGSLVRMPVTDLKRWFDNLVLPPVEQHIAERLLKEIRVRLEFLEEVGLGYLTLDRLSNTLSGGESQRINLASSPGASLVGSLYILDEPSIGLHSRDTARLIAVLRKLQRQGNTVVVVEHDEDIIRAADWIIDVGPKAGRLGGEIIYQGPPDGLDKARESYTMRYLSGELEIPVPASRRPHRNYIRVENATEHNLKDVTVDFPLGVMTVVTGVSGSGKSTLVRDIFYKALQRSLKGEGEAPGAFRQLSGQLSKVKDVVFVDQNPIGRSTRSNPATYIKAYEEIRNLFASQQLSKQMGFTPAFFSFNTEGGRCENCKGEGVITVEMQFLADVTMECEVCHGQRFKRDVLEVKYKGRNIHDVLEMTVEEAIAFFGEDAPVDGCCARIVKRLQSLADVGLGYIRLGQSSSTLSGGENQRVKLAWFLSQERPEPTVFIFDEPTTGLHFHDIHMLMASFDRLLAMGHTLVIVEHNMDVVKCADHVIDLGPEGGEEGGRIVGEGTPEQIASLDTPTGHYLKPKLHMA